MKRWLGIGATLVGLVALNIVLPRVTNPYYFQILMLIGILSLTIDAVGAARGLPGIPPYATFFWVYGAVVAVIVLSRHLAHSTHGRALFAIRDDEVAAEALGVDTTRYKVLAFVLGAFFAGIAGGLFAHDQTYLNPSTFQFIKSMEVIALVVLGGLGSVSGSARAAFII